MSKQKSWDTSLIECWVCERDVLQLIQAFIAREAPILLKMGDYQRMKEYIGTLGLNRCFWPIKDGYSDVYWNLPIRAVIAKCSPQLNNYLWQEQSDPMTALENIDNFKWRHYKRSRAADKASSRAYRNYKTSRVFLRS